MNLQSNPDEPVDLWPARLPQDRPALTPHRPHVALFSPRQASAAAARHQSWRVALQPGMLGDAHGGGGWWVEAGLIDSDAAARHHADFAQAQAEFWARATTAENNPFWYLAALDITEAQEP